MAEMSNDEINSSNTKYGNGLVNKYYDSTQELLSSYVKYGEAPWQQSHDGNVEKSFFPLHNYTPSGITAVYLKMQEQKLGTNDPRWYSRKDIRNLNPQKDLKDTYIGQNFENFNMSDYFKALDAERAEEKESNEFRPKSGEKETHLQLRIPVNGKNVLIEGFYYNGSQILGIPPYTPQYEKSEQKPEFYQPEKKNNFFRPKETLRADLVNWFNSLETHTPFTPSSFNHSQEVSKFLTNATNSTFAFLAKQASDISENMLQMDKSKVVTNKNKLSNKTEKITTQEHDVDLEAVKENGYVLQFVKEQTEEMCLAAVQQNGFALMHVNEQTPEICLAAVQQNGFALEFVTEQTPEICLVAFAYEKQGSNLIADHRYLLEYNHAHKDDDGVLKSFVAEFVFQCVREPTPEICLAAVKENGAVLEFVQEQTEEMCLAAVQLDGYALKYVQERTPEICLAAVQQYGGALEFVKEQTPEMCLVAVENYADALRYVNEQTEEMCLVAVQQDGYALKFVKEQTPEMCLVAVENYADALQYVQEQTEETCLAAVKQSGNALKYVQEQTEAVCLTAVQQNGIALQFVQEQTPEISRVAVEQNWFAQEFVKEQTEGNTTTENKLSNPSVDIPCHNPITGQIYTQESVNAHQQQSQSDDKRYLQPDDIDKLGMTIKPGAEPVVNIYKKENDLGQTVQHYEMLFNGKDIQGLPPPKTISEKLTFVATKIMETVQNIGKQTTKSNAKKNDTSGHEM